MHESDVYGWDVRMRRATHVSRAVAAEKSMATYARARTDVRQNLARKKISACSL